MPTMKENIQASRLPVLKSKPSVPDNLRYGGLKFQSSREWLSPSTPPRSSPRSATTRSPGSPLKKGTLPTSFVNSLAALTVKEHQTVARVNIDNTPAFAQIFEKRAPTVPKAPRLLTEQRALKREHSPDKFLLAPKRRVYPLKELRDIGKKMERDDEQRRRDQLHRAMDAEDSEYGRELLLRQYEDETRRRQYQAEQYRLQRERQSARQTPSLSREEQDPTTNPYMTPPHTAARSSTTQPLYAFNQQSRHDPMFPQGRPALGELAAGRDSYPSQGLPFHPRATRNSSSGSGPSYASSSRQTPQQAFNQARRDSGASGYRPYQPDQPHYLPPNRRGSPTPSPPHRHERRRDDMDVDTTNELRNYFGPVIHPRSNRPNSPPHAGDMRDGAVCPSSSPKLSEYSSDPGSESPTKNESHWSAKNPSMRPRRRDDDDDDSGGAPRGPGGSYGGGYTGNQSSLGRGGYNDTRNGKSRSSTTTSGQGQNQQYSHAAATNTAVRTAKAEAQRVLYGLNASAAWFIPQNGRFEQMLPREQLQNSYNWQKEEGKIPCGFGERAKFNQGAYSAHAFNS